MNENATCRRNEESRSSRIAASIRAGDQHLYSAPQAVIDKPIVAKGLQKIHLSGGSRLSASRNEFITMIRHWEMGSPFCLWNQWVMSIAMFV
jgi:hypothetical protein